MLNTTLQVRLDADTKNKARQILEDVGLDLSTAIKLYLKQVIKTKGVPFSIRTENGFTPEYEAEILREEKEMMRLYKQGKLKAYTNIEEMHRDIMKD